MSFWPMVNTILTMKTANFDVFALFNTVFNRLLIFLLYLCKSELKLVTLIKYEKRFH